MHNSIAHKLRMGKPGNHGKYPFLLSEFQIGLKSHQIIQSALPVFLAELHHCIGSPPGMGIRQSHRLQRAEPHSIRPTLCQHFNGHTTLVHPECRLVELLQGSRLRPDQSFIKRLILRLFHGTVDVIRISSPVPGGVEYAAFVQTFPGDNGGGSVIKAQLLPANQSDLPCQGIRRQRTGSKNDLPLRDPLHLFLTNHDIRV
ncbi:unknown [Ruminococcus sp. CAG:379]|nr:unknown [Ruminococcus sp. CAG:379]